MFELDRGNCPMRADNGNCLPVGGFCTAVSDVCCKIAHRSYGHGYLDNTLSRQPRLLTFEEVKDHYFVPVSKLQIERYNDYAEDIKPLYFEFPSCDGWEVHWRGYDKVFAYLREWEKDYGRTWRCWTDKPTDDQRMNTPWEGR